MPTRIYLDVCCMNRLFDNHSQERVRIESEAISLILGRVQRTECEWITSETVDLEVDRTQDFERRTRLQLLTGPTQRKIIVSGTEEERALFLVGLGFDAYDALHLACAESGGATVFLTTDHRLLRKAIRIAGQLQIRVVNPLVWVQETLGQ